MNQCFKISFSGRLPKNFLENTIQKNAKKLGIEGTVRLVDAKTVQMMVCGTKEQLDHFLDLIHKSDIPELTDLMIEPFLKIKDYRGVFRIIE
jgi:acylphosphatase